MPSASIGEKTGLYEPIHGSYPKAAGENIANPIGAILSAALLLEYAFNLSDEAESVRQAVEEILSKGLGTRDIASYDPLTTSELGDQTVGSL